MKKDKVDQAFKKVHRQDFVPDHLQDQVDRDVPLPIGFGQTISQPTTVGLMLEWLEVQPGDTILDIGSGSGWTTALLSTIVGPKGKVFAVEIVPELVEFGQENCRKIGTTNTRFFHASAQTGLPGHAPYDRILVSAAAHKLPADLLGQLKVGGKLVIPVQYDILEVTKTTENDYETEIHPGFVFVPLVENAQK